MVKDLSAFVTPSLDIRLRAGREVSIAPPSVQAGASLAAITTLGAAITTGEVSDEAVEQYQATVSGMTEADVKRLAVGDRYDWMVSEGWSFKDIDVVCRYATFYWVFGERVADTVMATELSEQHGKKAPSGKSRGRGKSGRRTA